MLAEFDFYTLLKMLVAQLLMPLPLCLMLFVCGVLLRPRFVRVGQSFMLLSVAVLFLLSWSPVADRLLAPFESRFPALHALPQAEAPAAILVLGAGYQPEPDWTLSGQLSDAAVNRLVEGVRLWHQARNMMLIVSGRDRDPAIPSMALAYADLARSIGVSQQRIYPLVEPRDTGEEARAAARLLGAGSSLVLVTSASHMPRAMYHFRKAGLKPIAAPTHYLALRDRPDTLGYWIPSARHLRKSERAFYEALGALAVRWE